jgi:hypothetical protein
MRNEATETAVERLGLASHPQVAGSLTQDSPKRVGAQSGVPAPGSSGLVVLSKFIQAIRDAGYRGTSAAVAELVDNAFEAGASSADIYLRSSDTGMVIAVKDNGSGMTPDTLQLALRFGGSTRFGSRAGVGRYGMGLPNSSVSQARRVDVYTWQRKSAPWWTYLDVDDVVAGQLDDVPTPARKRARGFGASGPSGTIVIWSRCDRVDCQVIDRLTQRLAAALGRVFRHQLWDGRCIRINDEAISPVDPLFVRPGANVAGAELVGPPLVFELDVPGRTVSSTVTVIFSLLPVAAWGSLSNDEKRAAGIAKGAGVTIVRAGREIDAGWHFMGSKRKENYDDWWRCEVAFEPVLDELFGVTHTKQGIHPTDRLVAMLTPDLECIAHQLNAKIRRQFVESRARDLAATSRAIAERRDSSLEPPALEKPGRSTLATRGTVRPGRSSRIAGGMSYRLEERLLEELSFFLPVVSHDEIVVLLNTAHPFYERVYRGSFANHSDGALQHQQHLELLLFAAARAEATARTRAEQAVARRLRESWSNTLAAFLA